MLQKNCHEGRLLRNNKNKIDLFSPILSALFSPILKEDFALYFEQNYFLYIFVRSKVKQYIHLFSLNFRLLILLFSFFALLWCFLPSKSAGLQPNLFYSGTILGLLRRGTVCGPLCAFALKSHQNRVNLVATPNHNKKLKMRNSRRQTVFHWDHKS